MPKGTKISYSDVISYFEDADLELAGLLFKLIQDKLESRVASKQAVSARMERARAGRKGGPRRRRPVGEQGGIAPGTHPGTHLPELDEQEQAAY